MDWRDEGLLLSVRKHGESSAIIEVLTAAHGRHAGLVHGGGGAKLGAVLQSGAQVSVEWRARLSDHLGTYKVEPIRSRAGTIMADRARLAGLNAMTSLLLSALPEREPAGGIYDETVALADILASDDPRWPGDYARWEVSLLAAMGFGLDLHTCAATGEHHDLAYVSPRSGRAVSRVAGGPWAEKMLPLPGFLIGEGKLTAGAVRESLRMTGYFLEHWAMPGLEKTALPAARQRLLDVMETLRIPRPEDPPDPLAEEAEWHRSQGSTRTEIKIYTSAEPFHP